ncbi:Golgi SNAP receptor complex member 1-like [Xenia sp. Carnegie-2017]|uniref:Golgi SNAP receptor complex member 1-like n=1 Tax=Xenia sp. Carnegie-2017 TaxID=2897299 RepID=UPI001F034B72|nr:Golgi SNAP receptor complex member 1-like [Xenia sp. Carnegie-2017]
MQYVLLVKYARVSAGVLGVLGQWGQSFDITPVAIMRSFKMLREPSKMAASSAVKEWEVLRKRARQIENDLDMKLVSFSKLGTSYIHRDSSSDKSPLLNNSSSEHMFQTMSLEIGDLLSKLTEVNDKMAEVTSNLSFSQPSASQAHTVQRHRDILKDYSQEFTKTKANIETFIEREELLGSTFKSSGGSYRKTDLYLKENEHIHNSDRLTDEAIGIAMATKENMSRQRGALYHISTRMGGITSRFPALNNLMQKINLRKRRDAIIISIVISICLILLILYATR